MTDVSARLTDKRPALFLDYDGTLTPIVERPQDARLSDSMRRALREAAQVISTAIVSGRDLEDVRDLVGLSQMIYAGSHGFDIRGPNLRFELPEGVDALDDLQQAAEALNDLLGPVAGARVERKRFAVAVHFRQVADADLDKVDEAMQQVQHQVPDLRRTGGKKIYELRPDIDWDKGRAVRWLLDKLDLASPDVLPIYIGDDETDEDAFRALADRDGVGILVAEESQPSAATYRLRTSEDVETFLRHLTEAERTGD
jgi:trehalose-phosphatase